MADSAYAGGQLRTLPERVSWTTRPRKDAALSELAPPRTGKRDRRADTPWYVGKSQPTTLDMITKLRRVLITTRNRPAQPTPKKSTPCD
ncbi:MAG: hypothetical protein ACRDTC_16455 [Pseudonocardiaceae bacterium]